MHTPLCVIYCTLCHSLLLCTASSSSVSRSHSPSAASSGLAASTELPSTAGTSPMMDSQPLIHDSSGSDSHNSSHHSDPSRPRASSSPASAQLSVRAIPPPLTLPATASVNLYPTAPSKSHFISLFFLSWCFVCKYFGKDDTNLFVKI